MRTMVSWLCYLSVALLFPSLPVHGQKNAHEAWLGGDAIHLANDVNDDPNVFETTLTAKVEDVEIDGTMVHALTYNGKIPGPMIRVKEGDQVIVHYKNELDFATTIHWHGVAGNNEMDGSPVTQLNVAPGETFTFDFIAANAGSHWYHSHHKTAHTFPWYVWSTDCCI